MKKRQKFRVSGIIAVFFVLFTLAVKFIDVKPIGPAGTSVGFARLNGLVFSRLGTSELWDKVTDLLLVAAILIILAFALLGALQFIKKRSIYKVDKTLIALGIVYGITACVYVFFETVVVNYRPVLESGAAFPEASFPSSHTVLSCVVFATAILAFDKFFPEHGKLTKLIQTVLVAFIALAIGGRLIAGVHWITDIVAGVIAAASISVFYAGLVEEN